MAAPASMFIAGCESHNHARDTFLDRHDFHDTAIPRASMSRDLETSPSNSFHPHTFPRPGGSDGSSTPTKASFFEFFDRRSNSATREATRKSLQRPRAVEHSLALGPEKNEKVWSIGSGDGEREDGLVEQSVTEAMAGVEPNARSRKASYSLRFFKEGLPPDDKGRRKDPKPSQRERLSPTLETEDRAATDALADASSLPATMMLPMSAVGTQSSNTSSLPMDPVGARGTIMSDGAASPTRPKASMHGSQEEIESPVVYQHSGPGPALKPEGKGEKSGPESWACQARAQGQYGPNIDGEANIEVDAEDSGEEKISSAVFLPHQEMAEARLKSGDGVDLVCTSRPRSLSQSKTHPWLVKADEPEPEPEIHDEEEPAFGSPTLRARETPMSRRGDVFLEPSDECVAEDALEARAVTQYENHVHEHQHRSRKPLEAIELIPYKHQVGGHTTLWRFSRRAVCKQLNNRENEFYETIERYHRDLLPFLPRYVARQPLTVVTRPTIPLPPC